MTGKVSLQNTSVQIKQEKGYKYRYTLLCKITSPYDVTHKILNKDFLGTSHGSVRLKLLKLNTQASLPTKVVYILQQMPDGERGIA